MHFLRFEARLNARIQRATTFLPLSSVITHNTWSIGVKLLMATSRGKRNTKRNTKYKATSVKKLQYTINSTPRRFSRRMFLLTCGLLAFLCLWLVRYHQASAMLMTKAKNLRSEKASDGMALSLWLIPPKKTYDQVKKQMDEFTHHGKTGPAFAPHITIIGGIHCQSEAHALEIARTLEEGLSGFGEIPCEPNSVGSEGVWNQALYMTVKQSERLMNLCEEVRELLGMDTENWAFPAPATHPHMSLYYGVDGVPDKKDVQMVAPFDAYRIALWRTDPASVEGVPYWREISSFSIR